MHSVVHHGSVLQAFATQEILRKSGHEVEIIDYQYPNPWHEEHGLHIFKPSLKTKLAKVLGLKPFFRGMKKITRFQKTHYHLSPHYKTFQEIERNPPKYDVYISGSDQIWNPKFTCGDPTYMFGFVKGKANLMSLSSSFACQELPENIKDSYKSLLARYQFLSVRENAGADIIERLLDRKATVTLDPTLLLDEKDWKPYVRFLKEEDPFLFLYMLDYAYNPTPYIYELTKYMSKKLGLKIKSNVTIPPDIGLEYEDVSDEGIEDFLYNVKYSSLVITSSFHGTAFSVNFGTPLFAVIKEKSKDDRLSSLLKNIGLANCIVNIDTPLNDGLNPFYEKSEEQKSLNVLRKKTMDYIFSSLKAFEK